MFFKKKEEKKKYGIKALVKQLPHAIMYLSDFFVFLMIVTWIFYIIMGVFAGWYMVVVNADTTIFTDLKDACLIPLTTGGVVWLLRCALNHYNSLKGNGKKLNADFPNEDDDLFDDVDLGDMEDDTFEEDEYYKDDESIEDDPDVDAEVEESLEEDTGDDEDVEEGSEEYFIDNSTIEDKEN